MEEKVKKRKVAPFSQNHNKRAKHLTDNREVSSYGATHKLTDRKVPVSQLVSTNMSSATSSHSNFENVFFNCKDFQ